MPHLLRFGLLGPLEVERDGAPVAVRGPRQRRLLALLLLSANRVASTDRLIEDLWDGRPPETAVNTLHVHVFQLRKALGVEGAVARRSAGYVLHVERGALDLERFEELVARGRDALASADAAHASALFRDALGLWRGEPLQEFAGAPFAQAESLRLDELRLGALEDSFEAELALGAHAELVPELEAAAAAEPLRERLRAQLMLALYRSGRQADALAVYADARRALVEELGLEPGPLLQRLQHEILTHDAGVAPAVATAVAARERRKPVTVVFFTSAVPDEDPEALAAAGGRAAASIRDAVVRHGGVAEELPGETLLATFGAPAVHEDDPLRAARAALDAARELPDLRAGIATGEALVSERPGEPPRLAGAVVAAAAAARDAAARGAVLLHPTAWAAVRDAARVQPGSPEPFARLLDVPADAAAIRRRLDTPLVGRAAELDQLERAFDDAVAAGRAHTVAVVGQAGIGKTRIARELGARLAGRALVLEAQCPPYGESAALRPLADLVAAAAGEASPDAVAAAVAGEPDGAAVGEALGPLLGEPGDLERVPWALQRLLEAVAAGIPLVVFLDDAQWAPPSLLELVAQLASGLRVAALLLVAARPDVPLETAARSVAVEPLSEADSRLLVDTLAGDEVASDVRERVAAAAEGNPLFVEQMLAIVGEEGADVSVPDSIHALLAARLDLLAADERAVVEAASVIGVAFSAQALAGVAERAEAELLPVLDELVPRQLLVRAGDRFRFEHHLIRETAYTTIPKRLRAELHERYGRRAASLPSEPALDVDEVAGYHLHEAHRYRRELDPGDARLPELAALAAGRLAAAGRRAVGRGDVRRGAELLRAALELEPEPSRDRVERLEALGGALRELAEFARADETLTQAIDAAAALGEPALAAAARVQRLRLRSQTSGWESAADLLAAAEEDIRELELLRDEGALAEAWVVVGWLRLTRCRAAEAEEAALRALDYARRAQANVSLRRALNIYLGAGLFGPLPVAEAIERCHEVIAEDPGPATEGVACRALGALHAMLGDFEAGRDFLARGDELMREAGMRVAAAAAAEEWAALELLAGRPQAAEEKFTAAFDLFEAQGEKSALSTLAAVRAAAAYEAGDYQGALRYSEASERDAQPDDLATHVQWRGPRAKVLASRGDLEGAEALAREGVALAGATDFVNMHARALLDLAEVLRAAGRGDEAAAAATRAATLYEAKGNVAALRLTRAPAGAARGARDTS